MTEFHFIVQIILKNLQNKGSEGGFSLQCHRRAISGCPKNLSEQFLKSPYGRNQVFNVVCMSMWCF